jgi:hypothetical protein
MKIIRPLIFGFILLFLSACQSPLLTDLATSHGGRLFWDDFTDTSGSWPVYSSSEGEYAYANGAYHITVNTAFYQLWALSGQAYKDVQVEADATRLAGPDINLYGLICRATSEVNYYFFVISSDGYYAVGKSNNDEVALLGQEMMAYNAGIAGGGGVNHLRFDCIGNTLTGYINGQMVALTQDSEFRNGDAGLIVGSFDVGGVEISFDNFVVYKP